MKRIRYDHRVVTLITAICGTVFIVAANYFDTQLPDWVSGSLMSAGTAFIALAFVEFLFQGFLKQDLIEQMVKQFKEESDLPLTSMYLGRDAMPSEQSPIGVIQRAKRSVYVKAISFGSLGHSGFLDQVEDVLNDNKELKLRFAILTDHFELLDQVEIINGMEADSIRQSINVFVGKVQKLNKKGLDIDCIKVEHFPTAGYWLIDHELEESYLKVEPYLYSGEKKADRVSIIFTRKDGIKFYEKFTQSVLSDWSDRDKLALQESP